MVNNTMYLSKEVFDYDLKMTEIRLLMLLSSYKISIEELSYENKLAVFRSRKALSNKKLEEMVERLNSFNLLQDGRGFSLKDNFIVFKNGLVDLKDIKNLRQLFLYSIPKYFYGKKVIISKDRLYNLFGAVSKRRNQYWKETNKQLGTNYQYEIEQNRVMIYEKTNDNVDENEDVEECDFSVFEYNCEDVEMSDGKDFNLFGHLTING